MTNISVSIMQPYLFANLNYFRLCLSDHFVVLDDVNFIKRGFINRNQFPSANGNFLRFTIPVRKASQNRPINDHQYLNDFTDLRRKFREACKNDRYFNIANGILEKFLADVDISNLNVTDVNILSMKIVFDFLSYDFNVVRSSMLGIAPQYKGQERILEICKRLNASHYVNAIGGRNLYDKQIFLSKKIELIFQQPYDQSRHPYEFWSILAVISRLGPNKTWQLIKHEERWNGETI